MRWLTTKINKNPVVVLVFLIQHGCSVSLSCSLDDSFAPLGGWDGYSTLVPCQGVSAMEGHLRATFLTVHTFLPCNLEAPALAGFLSLWQNAREKETK